MTETPQAEERFRYIGFDVFPKDPKPIFASPQEEKQYLEKIRNRGSKFFALEREHSLIEAPQFTKLERMVTAASSLAILLGFFVLPVGSVYVDGIGKMSLSGLSLLLNWQNIANYLALAGTGVTVVAGLVLAFLVLGVLAGLLQMFSILTNWTKPKPRLVEFFNRLGIIPVIFWIAAVVISLFGFPTPLWKYLGIDPLGASFNIVSLLSLSGWGLWLIFAGLLINSSVRID